MAYENQGFSLQSVQKFGPELERKVREFLGWTGGQTVRVVYFEDHEKPLKYDLHEKPLKYDLHEKPLKYDLQVDSCYPNVDSPEIFVSVTYCNPDKPGHSNENKLHLKIGELMLLKVAFPDIKSVLVIGGNQGTWMPYVLKVFQYFFDETIFMWEDDAEERLRLIKENPDAITLKHRKVWQTLKGEWESKTLWDDAPINSRLRRGVWEFVTATGREGELPSGISNEIVRHCMATAYNLSLQTRGRGKSGTEWSHYYNEDWNKLWQSRSYFNPAEAAIDLTLKKAGFAYKGGLAKDVPVASLLHFLGGTEVDRTKVSEDFVLYSRKYNEPVFIQSKSTGGGSEEHGKNIQNRTKEQLTRGLIYRGSINPEGNVEIRPQDFIWIGLLDGNWGVTQRTPLKYLHMLQWAGYQYLLASDSLVNDRFELLPTEANPLATLLKELDCSTSQSELESFWLNWLNERVKKIKKEPPQLQPTTVEPMLGAEQQQLSFWNPVTSEDDE
jgi:hypothetical protein